MYDGLLLTRKNSIFHMLRYCIFVGFVSGYAVSIYTLLVELASHYSHIIYSMIEENAWYIALAGVVVFICYAICTNVVKLSNVSRGSGVPQAMGLLRGAFIMNWIRGLIVMITCSVLGTLAGLSLGSEGPAMIVGGLAAVGASKLIPMYARNYMVTGGVSAGLAVAFNAPLSGLLITLEEGHKRLSPVIAFNATFIILTALFTSYAILGYRTIIPVLDFTMSIHDIPFLMILGLVVALSGIFFNWVLLNVRKLLKHLKFKKVDLRYVLPFALALILGIFLLPVTGGGAPLIKSLFTEDYSIKMLLLLAVVKLLYTIICTSAGVPGGIFIPTLAVGALAGAIYAKTIGIAFEVNIELYIIGAMVAYFTSISHCYATALILALELTHNPLFVIPAFFVCTVTKLTIHLLHSHGLYDTLLDLTIKENTKKIDDEEVFTAIIEKNSFADGRMLDDIILPSGASIVSCNGKKPEHLKWLALNAYDMITFRLHTLDNLYVKHTILAMLTSKNRDDDLDGTPPKIML